MGNDALRARPTRAAATPSSTVRAQTGADYAQELLKLGARRFRIEFLEESADDIRTTLGPLPAPIERRTGRPADLARDEA